jgi:uncharacterized protein DUF4232
MKRGLSRSGRLVLAAGALICTATAAGCASPASQPSASAPTTAATSPAAPASSASSGNSPAVGPASSTAAGASACATSSLQVKLGVGQGYAGGVYQVIDLTNSSGRPCTLYGYPGVSLVTGPPYQQIGLAAKRNPSTPPELVTLAPGATGSALLQVVEALNYPAATCGPVKATALKVYPPNQTEPVYLPTTSTGCDKAAQVLTIAAVRPGSGSS